MKTTPICENSHSPSSAIEPRRMPAAAARQKESNVLQNTFILRLKDGLHARPAAMIVRTAQHFISSVSVEKDGEVSNARSILGLMSLAAGRGSKLKFTIAGKDAARAMEAFQVLFESDFTRTMASVAPSILLAGSSPPSTSHVKT